MDAASEAHAAQIAGRLATAIRAVAERPTGERDTTAHELSTDVVTLRWDIRPITDGAPNRDARLRGFARSLADAAPDLRNTDFRLEYSSVEQPGDAHAIVGALRLADQSWLNFSVPVMTGIGPSAPSHS